MNSNIKIEVQILIIISQIELIQKMRQDVIQILDISGKPICCYEIDTYDGLQSLYHGNLLRITDQGLTDYGRRLHSDQSILEKYRFVLAANKKEKEVLQKVKPVLCYLRDQDMNANIIHLNPYQSVRYLRNLLQTQRKIKVRLVINEKQLVQDSESLLNHIYENVIIHVIQLKNNGDQPYHVYVKEPGADSKTIKIKVQANWKVQQLQNQVINVIQIPQQFLCLFYGGRILEKGKLLNLYNLADNASMYAVDTRKYMKKISMDEYNKRISQVRKVQQCNKDVMKIISSQSKSSQTDRHNKSQIKRVDSDQKSGPLVQREDDDQYYRDSHMNIDSKQMRQFEKRGNMVQQNQKIRAATKQLQKGRLVTNQTQVYQDSLGYVHELNKQKTVFRNGYQNVNVDIMQDKQGNIIQIQQDIINVKKDSQTGQVIKQQTGIVEDQNNNRTITKKQQVRDKQGNILRYETSRHQERSLESSKNSRALANYQEPETSQERIIQLDNQGNIHSQQTKMIQGQQKTIMINKDTIEDPDGNLLAVKTGVVQIERDDDDNVYKKKSQITQTGQRIVMVQTNQIINRQGMLIRKQRDTINITQGQDGSIIKQQTDVIEQDDNTTIIRRGIVEDSSGNLIKSQTKIIQIQNSQYGVINVHQQEEIQERVQAEDGQVGGTVEKEVQVQEDQSGNRVTVERQYRNQEGSQPTLFTTVTVQNQQGNIVSQKMQALMINDQNQEPQIQRLVTNYNETQNRVVVTQGISYENLDGSIIKSQKSTIKVQEHQDGNIFKERTTVTQQDGTKIIHVRAQLQDMTGKLLSKSSDVYELEVGNANGSNALMQGQGGAIVANAHQVRPVSTLNRVYNVDEEGNLVVQERQLRKSEGVENITQRQIIYDETGKMLMKATQIQQNQQTETGQTRYTVAQIVQQGNLTTVVQTNKIVDSQGNQIRTQQGTLQIQKLNEDLTRKQKQTIITKDGVKYIVHKQAYIDNEGNVLQQQQRSSQIQGGPLVQETFSSKIKQLEQDQKTGDFHIHERQVQTRDGSENFVVETRVTRNLDNQFVKATTDVTKYSNQQDGTVLKHQTNVTQKPDRVSLTQSKSLLDQSGQKIQAEISTKVVSRGQNQSIVTKQTNVYIDGLQKSIIQETVVQDSQGNFTKSKGKSKNIYYDEYGVQQQRQVQTYQTKVQQIQGYAQVGGQTYKQVIKQITEDQYGNRKVYESKITQNEGQGTKIMKSQIVENSQGQILQMSTKVVEIQELQHGSITRQQIQTINDGKATKVQAISISDHDGVVLCQKQNKIQVVESDQIIRTSQTNTVRKSGETVVDIVDTLRDEEGNIIDQNTNVIKIKEGQSAVTQYARKVAVAESRGQVTSLSRSYKDDQQGNRHVIEEQVIQDQGKIITVNTLTVQTPEGDLLSSRTQIRQQNNNNQAVETQIIQQGGVIKVVEYSEGQKASSNLQDLLGLGQSQQPFNRMQVKLTESINDHNMRLGSNKKEETNLLMDEDYMMPEQFEIVALDRFRNQTKLKVRYDQIIDQIGVKLVNKLGAPGHRVQFFKDGNHLQQYEMVSDLEIGPGDVLFYTIQ